MDDILASIRRIIADDSRLGAAGSERPVEETSDAEPAQSDGADAESEPAGETFGVSAVAELDPEPESAFTSEPPPVTEAPSASALPEAPANATPLEVFPRPPVRPVVRAHAAPVAPEPTSRDAPTVARPPSESSAVPDVRPEPAPARWAPAAESASRAAPEARPVPERLPHPDVLLSNATTASVGEAFNALSHTILSSSNARTLEDLVQDMLRPMLQTWLDDNLPPLVERLVRIEIERVARGRS